MSLTSVRFSRSGRMSEILRSRNWNDGGNTPIIVAAVPFTMMRRPRTERSPPKRDFQYPSESITVRSPLVSSSDGRNERPSAGWTSKTVRKRLVTVSPGTSSGLPSPVTVHAPLCHIPTSWNTRLSSL